MSDSTQWQERKHWSMPVSPDTYVEICGIRKEDTKFGFARDFHWGYNGGLDSEGNIHYYRVVPLIKGQRKQPDKDEVAKRLRELADHIESKKWPQIFGFKEEEEYPFTEINITLSSPWPG